MLKISKNIFKEINPTWIIFTISAVLFFHYMNVYHSTDVVYLASFMYDIPLLNKFFNKSLEIPNLFNRFGEHGMLGYNLLLLINAKLFHYTTYFDFIINYINIIAQCAILLYFSEKNIANKNKYYYFCLLIILMETLNIMQGTSISMETQVRLGPTFFLLGAIYFDKVIFAEIYKKIDFYALIILNIFAVNIFGTLYIFAMIPAVLLITGLLCLANKNKRGIYFRIFLIFTLLPLIYLIQYGFFSVQTQQYGITSNALNGLNFWLSHPKDILLSFLVYYGSSILGWAPLADKVLLSLNVYLLLGSLVTIIQLYATFLFFRDKIYKITYLPLILQSYSFFVLIMIMIGRWNSGDPQWMWSGSYWYQFHTKFSIIGSVLVFMFSYSNGMTKAKKLITAISMLLILIGLIIGSISAYIRAPHERAWREDMAKFLFMDVSSMPLQNGLTPFIMDKKSTEDGLKILRDNKLLVFSNPTLEQLRFPVEIFPGDPMLSGNYYSDGWISKRIKFRINTGASGELSANFFVPNQAFAVNNIFIYVDGKIYKKYEINSIGITDLRLTLPKNKNSIIEIQAENSFIPSANGMGGDSREIAIILSSFKSM